jgi:glycosyltransferase involved in cell wall biosynthesis
VPVIYHYLRDFPADASRLHGGIDKAVSGLAAGIAQAGGREVRSAILCESPRPSFQCERPEGCWVYSFDNSRCRRNPFGIAPDLRDFVFNEVRDGIVVLNAVFNTHVNAMSMLLRRAGVPYVVAPHNPYHPAIFQRRRGVKFVYWRLLERPMLRRAAAVQLLDRRHEQYLRDHKIETRVIEVENGFDPGDIPDEDSLVWRTDGPIRLLFFGRIDWVNKGLDLLIDAFARIAALHPDISLTLQGPDRGDGSILKNQIERLGLSRRVQIAHPDFHSRPGDLAAKYDLFVLPSRFEGFGLSALEAMLAARPLLISSVSGLAPHVARAACGVVIDSSVHTIQNGIEELLARRHEWRELGLRGRRYAMEHLDWSRIGRSALCAYMSLTGATQAAVTL